MRVDGVVQSQGRDPDIPPISEYGKITSEQKRLINAIVKGDLSDEEVKNQFLEKEEQKLELLSLSGKISEEQKAERLERAESFIDKKIENLSDKPPSNVQVESSPPKKKRAGNRLRSMNRSHMSSPDIVDYGKLNSEQWKLIRELRAGEISAEELRAQYLEKQEAKLNLLVESNKISEEEKARRVERFTSIIDKIISNFEQ